MLLAASAQPIQPPVARELSGVDFPGSQQNPDWPTVSGLEHPEEGRSPIELTAELVLSQRAGRIPRHHLRPCSSIGRAPGL